MTRARMELISLLGVLGAIACGSGDSRHEDVYYSGSAGAAQSTGGSSQPGAEETGGSSEGGSGNSTAQPTAGTPDSGSGGTSSQAGSPAVEPTAGAAGLAEGTAGAGGAPGEPPCQTTADCADGEVCAEYRVDGSFYCTQPSETGAELGEECTSTNLVTDECSTRLCLDFNHRCSELCTADEDCATDDGFVCIDFGIGAFCVAGCAKTADCPEGQVCRIAGNADNTDFHWACSEPAGSVEAGGAPEGGDCEGENDCVNGLCLSASSAEGDVTYFCTAPCETEADCPESLANCGEVQMGLPDSTTTPVSACTPP